MDQSTQIRQRHAQAEEVNARAQATERHNQQLEREVETLRAQSTQVHQGLQEVREARAAQQQLFQRMMQVLDNFVVTETIRLDPVKMQVEHMSTEDIIDTEVAREAIRRQACEDFDTIMEQVTDVNYQDSEGKTLLMHSVIAGFNYGVKKLLERGADVNILDQDGNNALLYVAAFPKLSYLEQIAKSTNEDGYTIKDRDGNTPFHLAVRSTSQAINSSELPTLLGPGIPNINIPASNLVIDQDTTLGSIAFTPTNDGRTLEQMKALQMIDWFLESRTTSNVKFNIQNNDGQTPFMLACQHKLKYLANALFDKPGLLDHSLVDPDGNSSFLVALTLGDQIICDKFLQAGIVENIDYQNSKGETALSMACFYGTTGMVREVLSRGATPNLAENNGLYPIHYSVIREDLATLQLLVATPGCIIDQPANADHHATPLYLAAQNGHTNIVQWLASNGANINAQGLNNMTPLFIAILQQHPETAAALIALNADFNVPNYSGFHPIHVAAQIGDLATLQLLAVLPGCVLDQPANADHHATPLYLAAQNGHTNVVRWLANNGANINSQGIIDMLPLSTAIFHKHSETAAALIELGAVINIPNSNGVFPVHIAAEVGDLATLQLLATLPGCALDRASNGDHPVTPLYLAAQNGHTQAVEWLVTESQPSLNTRGVNGMTPLCIAVMNKHSETAKTLIELGADVNTHDNDGVYPIHVAAGKGELEIVKLLARRCGSDKQTEGTNVIPIYLAAQEGHTEIVEWLATATNINFIGLSGSTPLCVAINHGHPETAAALIRLGANVNIPNNLGSFPIHLAALHGDLETLELLAPMSGIDKESSDQHAATPICVAANQGHTEIVKWFCSNGANINATGINGMTPLYSAIANRHPETAAALIELGANVNIPNNNGVFPVHIAAEVGDLATLQLLAALPGCELGLPANADHHVTPLYLAAQNGHTEIVRWLADTGIDINAQGLNDMTPLYSAIANRRPETAEALIELGADVNIPNNRGFFPVHIAAEVDDLATLQLLASDHPDTINIKARNEIEETPLHIASLLGRFEIVKWLTENGADIFQAETDGDTPIALASYSGNVEVINWFFELGANVNIRNNENGTPLHNALTKANIEAIGYLLSKGALINAQNNEGKTPLHSLLEQKGIDTAKKDQILRQHLEEFDLSMVDTEGRTALDYAREHCPELVDIFETQHADETLHEHFTAMPTEFEPSESEVLGEVADA